MSDRRTDFWDPDNPEIEDGNLNHKFTLTRKLPKTVFTIGQTGDDNPAATYQCVRCGGTKFNVGTGKYYTAIRCVECKWEMCVHEG